MKNVLVALAFGALSLAQPAAAVVVVSSSGSLTSTDPTQAGRLFRDGVSSAWTAPKTFPGLFDSTPHAYDLVNGTFAANAFQAIYYEITYNFAGATDAPFSAAYLNSFVAANPGTNYLGDAGTSPISGAAVTYQVIVPIGQQLIVNFHAVGALPVPYTYTISAFSDANRGEVFVGGPSVPEPATWAMMLVGFGGIGATMRYRKRSAKIAYA